MKNKYTVSIITLSAILFIAAVFVKLQTAYAWQYSSDLFLLDQALTETLKGNFGVDFSFGTLFGMRAHIFLLFLVPLKILLKDNMIILLLLLTPIFYVITAMVIYWGIKNRFSAYLGFTCSLFFLLMCFFGLHEEIYGFHLDSLSGFFAVIFVYFLSSYLDDIEEGRDSLADFVLFVIFYLFYISLKEEMAMYGTLFFLLMYIFRQKRMFLLAGAGSALFFVFGLFFIKYHSSFLSWRNPHLAERVMAGFRTHGIGYYFDVPTDTVFLFSYAIIATLICAYALSLKLAGKINYFALSLFLVAVLKILVSFYVVGDFNLNYWHIYPAIVMIVGALIFQVIELKAPAMKFLLVFACISSYIFLGVAEARYFSLATIKTNITIQNNLTEKKQELLEMKKHIDPEEVVSINGFTAFEWSGYRTSPFPFGISYQPKGIADHIIIEPVHIVKPGMTELTRIDPEFSASFSNEDILEILPEFEIVKRGKYYIMLKRVTILEKNNVQRELFKSLYGESSIGSMDFPLLR